MIRLLFDSAARQKVLASEGLRRGLETYIGTAHKTRLSWIASNGQIDSEGGNFRTEIYVSNIYGDMFYVDDNRMEK